jgi:amidase
MNDISRWSAVEQATALGRGEFSARELLEACLASHRAWNPAVNAVVTLDEAGARASAAASDRRRAAGATLGPADGLVVGVKDLFCTRGLRTTFGSPIYADNVPGFDHLIVERERAGGLTILGKTNTPEFGAGAQTFNQVFGVTRNPYDLQRTCGGSSGGSAVALACGMVSLADGSDFGGSLRAPAAWCNVAGLRPSPGRVPSYPTRLPWNTLSVHGPMARTAADLALFLGIIAGPDLRSPIALETPADVFAGSLEIDVSSLRLAFSPDLGMLPVDDDIATICAEAAAVFRELGARVDATHPDLRGGSEVFKTLRAAKFALEREDEIAAHREHIKQTVLDNAQAGFEQSGIVVSRAEAQRARLWHHVREFMQRYEFMLWPVNPVPPFPAEQETLTEVAGVAMATYVDWGALRHLVSILGLPAVSVPCGFTRDGLPVGIQIIGRHHRDMDVLRLAHAYEQATGHWRRAPSR